MCLKNSGKFLISILHPCFNGNHEEGIGRQEQGIDREVVVKDYFQPTTCEAPLPQGKTSVIWRHRTLEEYFKAFVACGFTVIDFNEPRPTEQQAQVSVAIA